MLPFFLLLILLAGCASGGAIKYKKSTDFSKYKTFSWWVIFEDTVKNEIEYNRSYDGDRFRPEVERRLSAKGFRKFTQKPDFLIMVETLVSTRTKTEDHNGTVAYRREGSFIVNFVDAKTKDIIWNTWSTGVIFEPHNEKGELAQTLREVLAALDQFPPTKEN